ncbi:DotH/IcmK family type IV secretion protein [Pseudomonas aeruginosa]
MTRLKMRCSLLAAAIACAIIQPAMAIDGFVEKRTGDPLVDKLIQSNHPLTSEQQLKLRAYQQNDAKALELKTPSDATRNSPMSVIDLTQGAPAKQVVLQQGYAATLMVVGENGSPWPIERVTSGDKGIVEPVTLESRKTAVELTPIAPWASTNLFVYLAGREEPIKLYARVSADPAEGLNDAIKVIIDGVPPGSSPYFKPIGCPLTTS